MKRLAAVVLLLGALLAAQADDTAADLSQIVYWQQQGNYPAAARLLNRLLATPPRDPALHARLLGQRAHLQLATGQPDAAAATLDTALTLATAVGEPRLLAELHNHQGNLLTRQQAYPAAVQSYRTSAAQAVAAGDTAAELVALTNAIHALTLSGDAARDLLATVLERQHAQPDSADKAAGLLKLGHLAANSGAVELAYRAYEDVLTLAATLDDARLRIQALGRQGELYAAAGRTTEAQQLLHKAVFLAEQHHARDLAHRWHTQLGQLATAQNDRHSALAAYRRAVQHAQPLRGALTTGLHPAPVDFRQGVGQTYYALADLLLAEAAATADPTQQQTLLLEARNTLEQLKAAEFEDYFADDCVAALQARTTGIDRINPQTAVLYPIILPDRLALLLSLPDGIRQYTVAVPAERLEQTVTEFRQHLTHRLSHRYRLPARQLHDWLIAPLLPALDGQGIDTLVFVPDGVLRTMPLAALFDGERFLIERYALATSPGLTLTDPQGVARDQRRALMNGLSLAVQDFPPLPYVPQELEALQQLFTAGQVLYNDNFVLSQLRAQLRGTAYDVVHIASHGLFSTEARDSFLLTYDGRLTMDELEMLLSPTRFRARPVELLTLSACQTAVGDDRAALGLAGLALKAGARSALASLWFVDDAATAALMIDFYQRLQSGDTTKAAALQAAQQGLWQQNRFYRHPFYWAPFLLIGNWL